MTTVKVDLGPRSYEIRVVSGQMKDFGGFAREALEATWAGQGCRSALLVTDDNLSGLVGRFAEALGGVGVAPQMTWISPGEAPKSLPVASTLFDRLVGM